MSKTVLVTGGSSGIGKATCSYLAGKGYKVYGSSRSAENGTPLENFTLVNLDLRQPETIRSAVEYIIQTEGKIDVLVNNAGVGIASSVEDISTEELRQVFEINLFGVLDVCRAVLPYMRAAKSGHIINISSIAGEFGLPFRGIYSASKGALELISESMSMELSRFNVCVSIVQPGDFRTNINQNRLIAKKSLDANSPYYAIFKNVYQEIHDEVAHAGNPLLVARTIYKILNCRKPKLKYKVATPVQRLSIFLHDFLPGRMFERILMKKYPT